MPGSIPFVLADMRKKDQELVDWFRTLYDQDKKAHAACIVRHGKRPELTGHETTEERAKVHKAQLAWDNFFENDL